MRSLIGFGRCTYYYFYILISTITKFIKEDILGLGTEHQILLEIKIKNHPLMILLLGFSSNFIISGLIILYTYYKYDKNMDNYDTDNINTMAILPKEENENEEKNKKNEGELIEANPINDVEIKEAKKDNNNNRVISFQSSFSTKFNLIHNDIASMEIESVKQNSMKFIILSSFLIVFKEILINAIYKSNDIFDYYFLNLIIIAIILRFIFKQKIYRHQIFSIILVSLISGSCLISCIFIKKDSNFSDNRSIIFDFKDKYYIIIILIFIYLCISISFCTGIIFQKNLMKFKYINPQKILFWKGVFGVAFCIIGLIISSNVMCFKGQMGMPPNEGSPDGPPTPGPGPGPDPSPPPNLDQGPPPPPSSENSENISDAYNIFVCNNLYRNNTYFDNFFSYFEDLNKPYHEFNHHESNYNTSNGDDNNNSLKIAGEILILITFFILHYISEITLILVNSNLTPIHYLITECLFNVINIPYEILLKISIEKRGPPDGDQRGPPPDDDSNDIKKNDTTRILKFVAVFVEFLGYLIFMEIILLNFCGLSKDTAKNIQKRAEIEVNNNIIDDTISEESENMTND